MEKKANKAVDKRDAFFVFRKSFFSLLFFRIVYDDVTDSPTTAIHRRATRSSTRVVEDKKIIVSKFYCGAIG